MPNSNDKESFIKRLTEIINTNIANEQFGVNELAREVGMSRSNLHRRVKSFTGKSVSAFICDVRLDKASQLLKESSGTISEIAFECGFHSTTYFSKCFKDRFGFSPGEARNQMNEADSQEENSLQMESRRKPGKSISIYYFLATSLILLLTIALIVWRPFQKADEPADKSIAVLPFINDSPDQERMYFINGTMDAIINNLSKIKDLRVVSRTSVEQYRDNPKPIPEVAKEMDVSYILEGSGHRDGDMVRLLVQLLDGKNDQHLWSKSYDASIEEVFSLHSEIAQLVAEEIEAIVTPKEKKLIEKIPTESQVAYDLHLRAKEALQEDYDLIMSEELNRLSLEYDSTYSMPYVTLGEIYFLRYIASLEYQTAYMDSAIQFINKALFYDDQNEEAYHQSGYHHQWTGEYKEALNDFNKTLELNPNFLHAHYSKAWLAWHHNDMLGAIENFHHVIDGSYFPSGIYRNISQAYLMAGFKEQSDIYSIKALEKDGDSAVYYAALANSERWIHNNREFQLELLERGYYIDSSNTEILITLVIHYLSTNQHEKSLEYCGKYVNQFNDSREIPYYFKNYIALSYLKSGFTEIANTYFEQQIDYCENRMSMGEGFPDLYLRLAELYAVKGENEKTYVYLKALNQYEYMPIYLSRWNSDPDPFFLGLQYEREYLQIARDMEAKYQAEHERVRQWLEENEML